MPPTEKPIASHPLSWPVLTLKSNRPEALNRSPDEIIDALPKGFDLSDPELFEALEEGAHVAVEEGWF